MKNFKTICKMSQSELKAYLTKFLKTKYNEVISKDGFIFAEGSFPVMLVAHMDTVHKELVKQIVYEDNGNIISSPQGIGGDDRAGIAMIMEIIKTYNCSVLFTEDEEIGCVGATKFVDALEHGDIDVPTVNYIIELDRMGKEDAVFYNCDNPNFEDFIFLDSKDWKFDYGSYTDIVEIAPVLGAAAVNFSCGYYNPHTTKEYVVLSEMTENVEKVKRILARTTDKDKFEYIENLNDYYGYDFKWYDNYNNIVDAVYYITAQKRAKFIEEEIYAVSEEEAIGKFLVYHPTLCMNDIVDLIREE